MRTIILTACICSLAILTACVIPAPKKLGVRGDIPESTLDFLKAGTTDRDEVLLHLGLPDWANQEETRFAYKWSTAWDVCASVGYWDGCSEVRKDFTLLIYFDNRGIVSCFEKQNGHQSPSCRMDRLGGDIARQEPPLETIEKNLHPVDSSSPPKPTGTISDSNFYTNSGVGFSMQFPENWTVTETCSALAPEDPNFCTINCGQDPMVVEACRDGPTGSFLPSYFLKIRVAEHLLPEFADPWDFDRTLFLQPHRCFEEYRTCDLEITVLESKEIELAGIGALRELYRVKAVEKLGYPYELYRLGAKRFGNQIYEDRESISHFRLLTYWFISDDRLFQVTGGLFSFWENDKQAERIEEAFDKGREVLEQTIRSFRLL